MLRFGYILLFLWLALTFMVMDSAPAPRAWTEWQPDYCRLDNCYCEPIRDRLVAQPIATYSNLGFVAAGLFVLWATLRRPPIASPAPTRRGASNPFTQNTTYFLIYGLALTTLGFFSFFYHASLTKLGDSLDLMGMYLITAFLTLYNLNRVRPLRAAAFIVTYFAIIAALALGLYFAYQLQQIYFVLLILIALAAEMKLRSGRYQALRSSKYLWAALACFCGGAIIWLSDSRGFLPCWPAAPITWHALWHVAAAAAAGLMFWHYRSNNQTESLLP